MDIFLVDIVFINVSILVVIYDYSINGCWWQFHYKPLMAIDGYFIGGY